MVLQRITSPHAHAARDTGGVMRLVILATLPGIAALVWHFGVGVLINITLTAITAVVCEALFLTLRRRPVLFYLGDYSALVTALLLGIALPPYCPWFIPVIGSMLAIVVGKHFYGGMGYNPFNPAMIGYVVLLLSLPAEMTQWSLPAAALSDGDSLLALGESLQLVFASERLPDAYTMATPLEVVKQNRVLELNQLYQTESVFQGSVLAGAGWEWVNIGFLLGGLFLLVRGVFTWHAPLSMLATISLLSILFYDDGSAASGGSPLFHLLSGGTMLGAFFIVTDPVTSAVSTRGRLIYGASSGLLVYVIRVWGSFPDAVAFSVLIMNFAAPFIDYYTLPRTYGQKKVRRATETVD
jgi:electron transport complex protein RnfD